MDFPNDQSIAYSYVDGISLTYGTLRKHIWTYAIGLADNDNACVLSSHCPCSQLSGELPPSFVHDNYYCESGTMTIISGIFADDPVWDGKGCSYGSSCCSESNLPWFYCQISLTAREEIETRICHDEAASDENVLVKELQMYVQ